MARPVGLSPGGLTFVGAWLVGLAVARLTGAAAVILLLAAAAVGFVCAALSGWFAVRRVLIGSIVAPPITTAGASTDVTLEFKHAAGASDHTRVTISTASSFRSVSASETLEGGIFTVNAVARFEQAGVFDQICTRVESAGPAGLIWWRRTTSLRIDPIHVAPKAEGPALQIVRNVAHREGPSSCKYGSHRGEIDGVRPWREGDGGDAVHWPSTLRSGDLIVHDRVEATDTTWIVPVDADTSATQLRWTLDEGLRHGHEVAVNDRQSDDVPVRVRSTDEAAIWAAKVAQRIAIVEGREQSRVHLLRRPISWPRQMETETTIGGRARLFTALAAFIAVAMLLGALSAAATSTLLAAAGIAAGAAISYRFARTGNGRPLILRIGVAAAAAAALVVIAIDADGIDGLLAALRGPMPDLLMLLVVLHGFEVIDRRTMRVHQAITFVVAAYAAGLRIDSALGWWLVAWAASFVAAILSTGTATHSTGTATHSTSRAPGPAPTRDNLVTPNRHRTPILAGVAWMASAAAMLLALLAIVPVPDGPARLGLPALSNNAPSIGAGALAGPDGSPARSGTGGGTRGSLSQAGGYLGFSETLDTSIRGDLGDEIVMRVRSPEPAFWRGQTFTEFDGRSWTVSPDIGVPREGAAINVPPTIGDAARSPVESSELVQTYFIEADLPNVVFAAYRPTQVVFDGTIWTRPDGALRSDVTLTEGSVYTVVSDRLQVTPEILRAQGDIGAIFDEFRQVDASGVVEPFLAIPDSTTDRTIELAEQLRMPRESTYDTILNYQDWLAANTVYDLNAPVPASGSDAVDDFLFESRRGFCEQIASTLAIMLRSQGIPTRLATGYIPGERDRISGVWKVRASDAHSWVEVWFPETGWEAFDPTATVPLAGDAGRGTVGGDLAGAALASIAAHPIKLGVAGLTTLMVLGAVRVLQTAKQRRRRGRWGLLQDRFLALDPESNTNPTVASSVAQQLGDPSDARAVSNELDRVAFDPTWADDDQTFESVASTISTLERNSR